MSKLRPVGQMWLAVLSEWPTEFYDENIVGQVSFSFVHSLTHTLYQKGLGEAGIKGDWSLHGWLPRFSFLIVQSDG